MHAVFLTLLMVTGADQALAVPAEQPEPVVMDDACQECDDFYAGGRLGGRGGTGRSCLCDWFGPMPQTCYGPRFGCYPGSGRTIHRFPAFHGYYYRDPYNYRMVFDYPWHAAPHEPMGYFTYEQQAVEQQGVQPIPEAEQMPGESPQPKPAPPKPVDDGQTRRRTWQRTQGLY